MAGSSFVEQFPPPKYLQQGGLIYYGYAGEVLFSQREIFFRRELDGGSDHMGFDYGEEQRILNVSMEVQDGLNTGNSKLGFLWEIATYNALQRIFFDTNVVPCLCPPRFDASVGRSRQGADIALMLDLGADAGDRQGTHTPIMVLNSKGVGEVKTVGLCSPRFDMAALAYIGYSGIGYSREAVLEGFDQLWSPESPFIAGISDPFASLLSKIVGRTIVFVESTLAGKSNDPRLLNRYELILKAFWLSIYQPPRNYFRMSREDREQEYVKYREEYLTWSLERMLMKLASCRKSIG